MPTDLKLQSTLLRKQDRLRNKLIFRFCFSLRGGATDVHFPAPDQLVHGRPRVHDGK
jgi:hypothetical protein